MVEKFLNPCGPILRRTKTHLYLCPHPLLRPYIAHYTVTFPDPKAPPGAALRIIPDASGCLVFIMRERLESYCWGATTKTVSVDNGPSSGMHLFVEFLPGGERRLTGFQQEQLADQRIPLSFLDKSLTSSVNGLLENSRHLSELTTGLDSLFLDRLKKHESLPAVLSGLNTLDAATVRELADGKCYSQRHLGRIFREGLGMGLKTYLRLLRVNRATALLRPGIPLAWVAQEAGYYDQAHFTHEWKSVCGVSPGTYLRNMSDFYNEPLKF